MDDLDDATLAGLGSAALGYVLESRERLADFELWLATTTGTVPVYPAGRTWRSMVLAARQACAELSLALRRQS